MNNVERRLDGCRRGFTLVELLIVVLIIVILISMLGLVFPKFQRGVKSIECQKNLKAIHDILQAYAGTNDGWYPSFNDYWGTNISHTYKYKNGRIPEVTPWEAMSDVARLKELGASPEVFFCPFHPHYGDDNYWQIKSWEEPLTQTSNWDSSNVYNYARVDFGYYFLINRGYRGNGRLMDGRGCVQKNSAGEDNLPIVADILHYRNAELKSGWWHNGGPDGGGLLNSSCNTLFLGGYVVHKEWKALEEQQVEGQREGYGGYGTVSASNDRWWFWLGDESEKY